jgi:hypothetical protein
VSVGRLPDQRPDYANDRSGRLEQRSDIRSAVVVASFDNHSSRPRHCGGSRSSENATP